MRRLIDLARIEVVKQRCKCVVHIVGSAQFNNSLECSEHTYQMRSICVTIYTLRVVNQIIFYTRFPSGKRLGEWRKNETKSIQRETNTTTPEIEE